MEFTEGNIIMKRTIKFNIKTILSLFLIFTITAVSSGCGNDIEEEKETAIKNDVYNIYETIKSDFSSSKSEKDLVKILTKWSKKNKLTHKVLKSGNLLISPKAKKSGDKVEKTLIQCSLGGGKYKSQAEYTAIILATIKNSDIHGKADVLFTLKNASGYYGALQDKKLVSKYKHIVSMNYSKDTKLFNGSAQTSDFEMKLPLSYEKTKGTKTYKVSITGVNQTASFDDSKTHTNPINTLASLLNRLKSSNVIFQICDYEGGSSSGTYPQSAGVTITVTANYEDKLLATLESEQEDFENENSDENNNAKYEFTSSTIPKESYAQNNVNKIMSLLYTLDDGIYKEKEQKDEPKTIANLGRISYTNGHLVCSIKARSIDKKEIKSLEEDYKKTAALCDFSFRKTESYNMWPTPEYEASLSSGNKLEKKKVKTKKSKAEDKKQDAKDKSKDDKEGSTESENQETKTVSTMDIEKYISASDSAGLNLKPMWSFNETKGIPSNIERVIEASTKNIYSTIKLNVICHSPPEFLWA